MGLLWFDGFDHYGTDTGNLTSGNYAQITSEVSLTTANPATGTHALRIPMNSFGDRGIRLVLSRTAQVIGVGQNLRLDALPTADVQDNFLQIRNASNAALVTFGVQADGHLTVRRGQENGAEIASSGDKRLTAAAYYHIELRVFHSVSAGSVEVRVNGVPWIDVGGVDTGAGPAGQLWIGCVASGNSNNTANRDDLFVWDDQGSVNNDFLGPKAVFFQKPDQDTAQADFSVTGAATGFDAIDDAAPDGDTSYISAAAVADISEFEIADLPAEVTQVLGVMLFNRARKTDSGDGSLQASLVSAVSESAGTDNALSTAYVTRNDIFEADPNTGAPPTPAAFNAMKLKFERTL